MSFLRKDGKRVFTSSQEVISYYITLIDELKPQLKDITQDNYQATRGELATLRQELMEHLRNFGHHQVDAYFQEAIASAESNQEYYGLSNAYETILLDELARIKEKLQVLRTT